MAITVDASSDIRWIRVVVPDSTHPEQPNTTIAIDREALDEIFQEDPRPPEVLLDLIAQRAVKRMPVANTPDGSRLITPYNIALVWPK